MAQYHSYIKIKLDKTLNQVLYVLCLYKVPISDERLQDPRGSVF